MAGSGAETHRKMGRKVRKTGYAPRAPLQTASKIVPPVLPFCTISRTENYERSRAAHNKKTVGSVIFMRKWRKIYV